MPSDGAVIGSPERCRVVFEGGTAVVGASPDSGGAGWLQISAAGCCEVNGIALKFSSAIRTLFRMFGRAGREAAKDGAFARPGRGRLKNREDARSAERSSAAWNGPTAGECRAVMRPSTENGHSPGAFRYRRRFQAGTFGAVGPAAAAGLWRSQPQVRPRPRRQSADGADRPRERTKPAIAGNAAANGAHFLCRPAAGHSRPAEFCGPGRRAGLPPARSRASTDATARPMQRS
jgi:hypothetical protein